jgi:hypothetical protein
MVRGMTLLRDAVVRGDVAEVGRLVVADARSVRTLLALTYQADPAVCETAAAGLALAAPHHPRLVAEAVKRLIWAMNDESGTNAVNAPLVIERLADAEPRLLVPVLSDLLRLTADPLLKDRLVGAIRRVAARLPEDAALAVSSGLGSCFDGGRRRDQ